jgi:tetratricopeptide (TPR) repeat protein
MLRVGEQIGDREIQLQAEAWLITDALENEPIDALDGYLGAHARLAGELHQPYHLWFTEVARAMRFHLDGRFADMAEAIESAWRHGQTAHGETARGVYSVQMLHLKHDTGGSDEMIELLEKLAAESPLPAVKALLALAYADADREVEALTQVEYFAGAEFAAVRRDCVWSSTICFLAEVVSRYDAVDYSPPLYRLLVPFADRNCVAGGGILCLGPVSRFLGMLARVNGDHDRALQHLRHALVRSQALGSAPLVARTQLEKAKVLLARGAEADLARARELLVDVQTAANQLGMEPLVHELTTIEMPTETAAGAVGA